MKRFAEATSLAVRAFDLAANTDDPTCAALVTLFEPTLARIFLHELDSPSAAMLPMVKAALLEASQAPRTAFLMSRLDPGMCISDALDVACMPPLETLRRLLSLVTSGEVHLEPSADRYPPVARPIHAGVLARAIVALPSR